MKDKIKSLQNFLYRNAYPFDTSNVETGILRILFFGLVFLTTSLTPQMVSYSEISANLYCSETMGAWAYIKLTPEFAHALMLIYKFSILSAMIGFLFPWACGAAFFSSAILNMDSLKFCFFDHKTLPLQAAFILWALLDVDSKFRVDNLLFKKRSSRKGDPAFLMFMMRLHFCIIFFGTGVAKLRNGGLDWITTDSLRNYLILQNYFFEFSFPHESLGFLNHWVIDHPIVCNLLALETVLIEFFSPLALFKNRWTRGLIFNLLFMQVGIYFLMFFRFTPWLCIYIFWIPISSKLLAHLSNIRTYAIEKYGWADKE